MITLKKSVELNKFYTTKTFCPSKCLSLGVCVSYMLLFRTLEVHNSMDIQYMTQKLINNNR